MTEKLMTEKTVEYRDSPRSMNSKLYAHPDHVRRFGFDVTLDDFAKNLSHGFVKYYGLFREDIYLCKKNNYQER